MPTVKVSLIPVITLMGVLAYTIVTHGADAILDLSPYILGGCALLAFLLTVLTTERPLRLIWYGILRSGRQILPAIPILLLIGALSSTWMLSGTVPLLIHSGLAILSPAYFLPAACVVCAIISVVTGSSWTTIATIGVALMGIGTILGLSPAWVAGAIISGAYFGDKVSPLSDTTVLASGTCGVDLFRHIKNMMITTVPAMAIALAVYAGVGAFSMSDGEADHAYAMAEGLEQAFNLSAWLYLVPTVTCVLIALRVKTLIILTVATLGGLAAMWIAQPQIGAMLGGGMLEASVKAILLPSQLATGSDALDELTATGGMTGMLPTIYLILGAMMFGGVMIGSGMLKVLTRSFIRRLRRRKSLVGATVMSGLFLNATTGDQYISLIIGGNVYRGAYHRAGYRPELLSRSLEDSISVTSVLIPWNSCGMTQATVLGVATIVYAPFCIFNIVSPIMSVIFAWISGRGNKTPVIEPEIVA
ncbi:MAG: hypothetical protein NC342_05075 [Pseudoflavonifractor sp.]|nr:sodium:proton antiporter [Alloprevotella sp.]MCM1116891.1 hypothetical protein [Pseudoflavonifractor sp.]